MELSDDIKMLTWLLDTKKAILANTIPLLDESANRDKIYYWIGEMSLKIEDYIMDIKDE